LGNLLEQELDDELRRQMQTYGQRYDVQTGLLNYRSFQAALARLLRERSASREVALIWIDVLHLRREFALWGAKGTEALVALVAEVLRGVVGPDAIVGRYSARCFIVALEASTLVKSDRRHIQMIVDAIGKVRAPGSRSRVETAAGVAFSPSDTDSAEDLPRFASLASSRAGYLKSPHVLAFRSGMNHHLMRDHLLETEMQKALDQKHFSVFYQPEIELATGRVLGAEALIRWNHPEPNYVTPSEFIPVAERSELIQGIVDFSLRTALKDAQMWREMGFVLPFIAVNTSWSNLRREDFAPSVRARLLEMPIAPTKLTLEVTESVLFDDEELFATRVRQLKAMGVRVAIDDFGTRYTGFNVLKRVALDTMKIDRCFIHGIDHSRDMRSLCQTIVAMGRQLKLRTVAEGVEEPGELEVLRQIGCDAAQGFLFQKPMPAEEMAGFLRIWPQRYRELCQASHREPAHAAAES
jgi:EAL domain-containing protein (putative c-di-GMP-specific phosphodiesterase class I)/GGDEF domain-containing protein